MAPADECLRDKSASDRMLAKPWRRLFLAAIGLNLVVVAVLRDRLLWGWALCLNQNKEDYYYYYYYWSEARRQMATDLIDHERLDAAKSGLTSQCHFVTTGTSVSTVVTVEWYNGPRGLRDDDDDDDDDDNVRDRSHVPVIISRCDSDEVAITCHLLSGQ